ncbi:Uncharacterized protein TCM_033322 [Theobroma cacao]|uniref:Secreted protein n=1 Tax=Theobroma cacao TaxID=3641 RepID=A0A061FBI6_THECC|nr:Uncharacterized protein TCM_033322 [Theobroma cacao]
MTQITGMLSLPLFLLLVSHIYSLRSLRFCPKFQRFISVVSSARTAPNHFTSSLSSFSHHSIVLLYKTELNAKGKVKFIRKEKNQTRAKS